MRTRFLIITTVTILTVILLIAVSYFQQNVHNNSLFAPEFSEVHQHASILVKIFGEDVNLSASKYQLVSYWANFEEPYENIIHIQSDKTTVRFLFETLNFKINQNCFILDDGADFCTNEKYSLKYFINNILVSDIQNYEIHDGDRILISYGNETQKEIEQQLKELLSQPLMVDKEHLLRDKTVLLDAIESRNNVEWKKYITVSANQIDKIPIAKTLNPYKLDDPISDAMLESLLNGADACKNRTDTCKISSGISMDRYYSFGVSVSDNDEYAVSLNTMQAEALLDNVRWNVEGDLFYAIVEWGERHYLLLLSSSDQTRTPVVKMKLVDTMPYPVNLERGVILNYTIQVDTWATYGTSAQIDLRAIQNAKDSGINVWIEPDTLTIPERSNATTTLFIESQEDAKDGIYDVRVNGVANGNNAGLHCGNTVCPSVNIGNSDWHIHTFGSAGNRGIGASSHLENTWIELELNKKEFFEDELIEIHTYLVNNNTEKISFIPDRLLIKVIKSQPIGYYDNLYGIDAVYESDEPVEFEPKSKTLLARPFYWNQNTFENFDDEQRVDARQHKMMVKFVGENYSWNDDMSFEIK